MGAKKKKGIDAMEMVQWLGFTALFLIVVILIGVVIFTNMEQSEISNTVISQISEGYWAFALMIFGIGSVILGLKFHAD